MRFRNLSLEQFSELLQMAVDGRGKFKKNRAIYFFVKELKTKYYYDQEELFNSIVVYMVENNIQSRKGTKLGTHFTNVVYYYLINLVRKERRRDKVLLRTNSKFSKSRLSGQYNRYLVDNYTDNTTPESDLIEKEFIDIIQCYFSPLELDCLLRFRTRKDSAEMTGENYKHFCRRLNEKIVKIRKYLKEEGYEKKDFISLEKKRRLLIPT